MEHHHLFQIHTPIAGPSSNLTTPSPLLLGDSPLLTFLIDQAEQPTLKWCCVTDQINTPTSAIYTELKWQWNVLLQQEFNEDFCRFLVANDVSWNTANNPKTWLLLQKWIPGAIILDWWTLSGPILDKQAGKVEVKLKMDLKGNMATYITDGWKNVLRQSITAGMINVRSEVSTWGIGAFSEMAHLF